jgi:hypothetical protein
MNPIAYKAQRAAGYNDHPHNNYPNDASNVTGASQNNHDIYFQENNEGLKK